MRAISEIFRSHGVLDAEGRHVNGTDKETNHRYGDAYEGIIAGLTLQYYNDDGVKSFDEAVSKSRERVKLMMEVGVADGSSLLAWSEVFPNSTCVGLDIHPAEKAHGERIEFYLGDQRSKQDCDRAAGGRQFDFICEDATHNIADSMVTLLYLWPYVRPGGLYVIEEFSNIGELRSNVKALWCGVEIVDTVGPFGGVEPLVLLRKPL